MLGINGKRALSAFSKEIRRTAGSGIESQAMPLQKLFKINLIGQLDALEYVYGNFLSMIYRVKKH